MAPNEEEKSSSKEEITIPSLIQIKRNGGELNQEQISQLVKSICDHTMEDAQLGAFLMSVFLKGMSEEETANLTEAMKYSGNVFEWPSSWTTVDKHSTGGVGDKVSLVLTPALASLGLKVPMISGRGLGHTGGTLDKLESIPGFRVSLSENEIMSALKEVGCCIVGQTETLVPADKRMYSVRDVTSTVSSVPLIVSSIISKKACESLKSLVLDVKFGSGSVMGEQFAAESLAQSLVTTGNKIGIKTTALVTSNDHPIGKKVGNALEVEETVDCLRGKGPQDLITLVTQLGAELLFNSGFCESVEKGRKKMTTTLIDGSAMKVFSKMLQNQGVSKNVAEKICEQDFEKSSLCDSKMSTKLFTKQSGYIHRIDAMTVAEVCSSIGAGRLTSSGSINHAVGMILKKTVGESVGEGEAWAEIRHDSAISDSLVEKAQSALKMGPNKPSEHILIANRVI